MIFSDRGAWHGYQWDEGFLRCVTLADGKTTDVRASERIVRCTPCDDRLDLRTAGGGAIVVRFIDARTAAIESSVELKADPGPLRWVCLRPGLYHHIYDAGPAGAGETLDGLPRTLRWNWRGPIGDIRHGGCLPSPHMYRGFWAWDSWKHATVLPTPLARQQIQAMFDHQREDGMVPDTVMPDARENNWKNTKPPLAAWACSKHPGLLKEFRPPLLRYHRWWEANRRPPGERLLAYGGEDLLASKWESGWDNATRYDEARLVGGLQNILSVDLNAFLCLEKRLLGMPDAELERQVNEVFFHDGAFTDVTWPEHRPVRTLTAATWIPLWCGIATPDRAESVIRLMLDPAHFATPLPFPTVARSDAKVDPDGYWRGPVWMDYAAWACEALARYGRVGEARRFAERLLAAPADWECYNPLTGEPARGERPAVPQFSWTAAARVWLAGICEGGHSRFVIPEA
ncbi:MAG: hypothetical protein HYY16_03340 [Planctomycetes bacterium]|nr:hypothetical protein [Planctomycetota bacterium]